MRSRIDRAGAVKLALLTGFGGFVLAVLSGVVAASTTSADAAILVRAVLVTLLLVLATRVALSGLPSPVVAPTAVVGLLVGYVLTLGWFEGQVYVARLLTDREPVAALLDLLLWLAVGLGASRLVRTAPARPQGYV